VQEKGLGRLQDTRRDIREHSGRAPPTSECQNSQRPRTWRNRAVACRPDVVSLPTSTRRPRSLGTLAAPIAQESALSLELANGSRILSLPGTEATVRGYSNVGLFVCEFVETEDQVFSYDQILRAVSNDVAPLFPAGVAA
jgi:hypothetical protein